MTKNNTVDTAQKGQTTIDKTPTGKVKTLKSAEERRKAREEQFRNFRINALKRRCKRYGFDEKKTEEYIEKLKKQMDEPNQYTIIVCLRRDGMKTMEQAVLNAKLSWTHRSPIGEKKESDGYFAFVGDQKLVDKILEIAPPDAKIHRYAKKMESVIPKQEREVTKKPSNNTAEAKKNAKAARKEINKKRGMHKKGKGKFCAKQKRILSLSERKKQRKAVTVQLNAKKSSTGSKKASTNVKKAA